jgi:hypothetical protein
VKGPEQLWPVTVRLEREETLYVVAKDAREAEEVLEREFTEEWFEAGGGRGRIGGG